MPNCVRNDRLEAILNMPLTNATIGGAVFGKDVFARSEVEEQEIRDALKELVRARKKLAQKDIT